MTATLVLVLVIALAYLATHVLYDWVAKRYKIVSGAEYLVLGYLLGPQVSGIFDAQVLQGFAPLTTLTLGWVGVLVGMQFHLPRLIKVPGQAWRIAFGEALLTLSLVAGVMTWLFSAFYALPTRVALGPGLALGAIAASVTPAGVQAVAALMRSKGAVLHQLEIATNVNNLVAISAFGLLLCFLRPPVFATFRTPTVTEWAVIAVGIGIVGGALFHLFLGNEKNPDRLVISVAGAVILASGTAAYLQLSPILSAMIVGFILVNTSRNRERVEHVVKQAERPLYFVLLVFAGAMWQPPVQPVWFIPVLVFLGWRAMSKIGAARLVTRWNGAMPMLGPHWGRALMGQGALAIALSLDYVQHAQPRFGFVVFSAAALSVLLTEFAALRLVSSVTEPLLEPLMRIPIAGRYLRDELRTAEELADAEASSAGAGPQRPPGDGGVA
ncbi:MAG TPA: hypothetical protein VFG60_03015 [Burkholderiaceae bacterium]|nr:hypothetical protein [Burkholderiaceae bacterium]